MAKKEIVAGRNIYKLEDGQNVIYDRFSKAAYIVKDKHASQLNYYSNRYIVALVLGILIATFNVNIFICIAAGVLALAISEYKYRKFLDTLTQVPNFDIQKYNALEFDFRVRFALQVSIVIAIAFDTNNLICANMLIYCLWQSFQWH